MTKKNVKAKPAKAAKPSPFEELPLAYPPSPKEQEKQVLWLWPEQFRAMSKTDSPHFHLRSRPPKKSLNTPVPESKSFVLSTGTKLRTVGDLLSALAGMQADTYKHHVTASNNDFASWVEDVFHAQDLTARLRAAKDAKQAMSTVRDYLLS